MNKSEIWKPVKNYEGIYEISNLGRVKSLPREKYCGHVNSAPQLTKERILKVKKDRLGYSRVKLSKNGISNLKYIHRIIAEAFIDNPKNKGEVNHIDGNKDNNKTSNLEWCSRSENVKHAFELKLHKTLKGELNNKSKLNKKDVNSIRRIYKESNITQTELAKKYNVTSANIHSIVNFKTWKDVENENV